MSETAIVRNCPKCNKEIRHSDEYSRNYASEINRLCRSCAQIGRKLSDESKKKMSLKKLGKPSWSSLNREEWGKQIKGEKHPFYGGHHTEMFKKQQSNRMTGRHLSDETKKKLRISSIKQHKNNGMNFPAVDRGAEEYFNDLNKNNGYNIKHPNFEIEELGYFVDGYDPILHAVFEYDTKVHNSGRYKKTDLKRQTEIIEYYKKLGNPLNGFYRVNRTGFGIQDIKNILTTTEDK
jgi:hypothetical protein